MTVGRPTDQMPAPQRLLHAEDEAQLSPRARAALDQLEDLFIAEGFARFTVRDLAGRLKCSLRTLYEIAPSKRELVLVVLDRFLHRVGRSAVASIDADRPVADRLRAYFEGGAELLRWTVEFSSDARGEPELMALLDRHFAFVGAIVEGLIAEGVARGEMRQLDPRVPAAVMSAAASHFTRGDVSARLDTDAALEELLDVVLHGIAAGGE